MNYAKMVLILKNPTSQKLYCGIQKICRNYLHSIRYKLVSVLPNKQVIFNFAVHDVQPFSSTNFNTSHRIRHLSFGKNILGKANPIDGTDVITHEGKAALNYIHVSAFLILHTHIMFHGSRISEKWPQDVE
jgi:hypothetical protein